jgi:hypothetical protein
MSFMLLLVTVEKSQVPYEERIPLVHVNIINFTHIHRYFEFGARVTGALSMLHVRTPRKGSALRASGWKSLTVFVQVQLERRVTNTVCCFSPGCKCFQGVCSTVPHGTQYSTVHACFLYKTSGSVALRVMCAGEARRVPRLTSLQRDLTREVAADRREISRHRIYVVVYSHDTLWHHICIWIYIPGRNSQTALLLKTSDTVCA